MFFTSGPKLINKLRHVALNFGKDLLVSYKIEKVAVLLFPTDECFYQMKLPLIQALLLLEIR